MENKPLLHIDSYSEVEKITIGEIETLTYQSQREIEVTTKQGRFCFIFVAEDLEKLAIEIKQIAKI